MSVYQFAHLQTFSRKPNPAGQCVDQVFGELIRKPNFSIHVTAPQAPLHLDGLTAPELMAAHERMVTTAVSMATIRGVTRTRALRSDRHTLATGIASYPISWAEIGDDPALRRDLDDWQKLNIRFFRDDFGPAYRATFLHLDERYPHLHVYALPEGLSGCDAVLLHCGKRAKRKTEAQARAAGATNWEAVGAGKKALQARMREWQDEYFLKVGEPCGLLRFGPKRERLSRADFQREKAAAARKKKSSLEADRAKLDDLLAAARADREHAAETRSDWQARQDRTRAELRGEILAELEDERAGLRKEAARLHALQKGIEETIEAEVKKRLNSAVHAAVSACLKVISGVFSGETRFESEMREWKLPESTQATVAPYWKTLVEPAIARLHTAWARLNKTIASNKREMRQAIETGTPLSTLRPQQAKLANLHGIRDTILAEMSAFEVRGAPPDDDTLETPAPWS